MRPEEQRDEKRSEVSYKCTYSTRRELDFGGGGGAHTHFKSNLRSSISVCSANVLSTNDVRAVEITSVQRSQGGGRQNQSQSQMQSQMQPSEAEEAECT